MFHTRLHGLVRTVLGHRAKLRPECSVGRVSAGRVTNHPVIFIGKKLNRQIVQFHASILSFFTFLHMMSNRVETKGIKEDFGPLLAEADDLFNQNKFSDIIDLLENLQHTDNVEVLWRLSRAMYNMAKEDKSPKGQALLRESFRIAKRGLELDDTHFAVHKWYALLLDETAALDGIKARINVSMSFKDHMLKATELNPQDATSLYILGSWCFAVAELPWYQRKIAAALFATPPSSTYEEALIYFKQAEQVEPNFYSRNLLMLGKTYLRLKDNTNARIYLSQTALRPARTDEDHQACKEAEELLKHIKV